MKNIDPLFDYNAGKYSELYKQYSTTSSKEDSEAEQLKVRFNIILQGRKELGRNLTGSQITYILDYYIRESFSNVIQLSKQSLIIHNKLLEFFLEKHKELIHTFFQSKKRLISIRYSNSSLYCKLVNLNFVETVEDFCNIFLSLRLNRTTYTKVIEELLNLLKDLEVGASSTLEKSLSSVLYKQVTFLQAEFKYFKGLLAGKFIRLVFNETTKFYKSMQALNYKYCDPIEKQDYFSGLIITTLNAIDRYDSFKGALKSYLDNWYKDYRLSYKDRLITNVHYDLSDTVKESILEGEDSDNVEYYAPDFTSEADTPTIWDYIKEASDYSEVCGNNIQVFIKNNAQYFPTLNLLVAYFEARREA